MTEEKKNTMENMTEKDLAIKMANRALEVPYADPDSDICTISRQFLRALELTAIGSVAAPKDSLIDLLQSHRLSYTFEEDGETGLSLLDRLTPPRDNDVSRGNDEIQLLAEEIEFHYSKELTSLRQQLKEREEVIKGLLPLAERMGSILGTAANEYYKVIIERAP